METCILSACHGARLGAPAVDASAAEPEVRAERWAYSPLPLCAGDVAQLSGGGQGSPSIIHSRHGGGGGAAHLGASEPERLLPPPERGCF